MTELTVTGYKYTYSTKAVYTSGNVKPECRSNLTFWLCFIYCMCWFTGYYSFIWLVSSSLGWFFILFI